MKSHFGIIGLILFILCVNLFNACKKDKPAPPVIATTSASEISYTIATSGGDVKDNGSSPVLTEGICWNTSAGPTVDNSKTSQSGGIGVFVSKMEQLTPNTKYYVRAYATSDDGTGYGNEISFTTTALSPPGLSTKSISSIKGWSAISGGTINSENGSPVTVRGVCWSTTGNPTINDSKTTDGSGTDAFSSNIAGLTDGTTYHVRAYATNSTGTGYGEDLSFTTLVVPIAVTDIDGNGYHSVALGTQVWLMENLKTTKYNDGTPIPLVISDNEWSSATTDEYCWYNNDSRNKNVYGALYNWKVVDASHYRLKNVCPVGWRVPAKAEWTILLDYLSLNGYGYGSDDDMIAKSIASAWGWENDFSTGNVGNNQNTNNTSGFTGLPAGLRQDGGNQFNGLGRVTGWWALPDDYSLGYAYWYSTIGSYSSMVFRGNTSWNTGVSVRCIKN